MTSSSLPPWAPDLMHACSPAITGALGCAADIRARTTSAVAPGRLCRDHRPRLASRHAPPIPAAGQARHGR